MQFLALPSPPWGLGAFAVHSDARERPGLGFQPSLLPQSQVQPLLVARAGPDLPVLEDWHSAGWCQPLSIGGEFTTVDRVWEVHSIVSLVWTEPSCLLPSGEPKELPVLSVSPLWETLPVAV